LLSEQVLGDWTLVINIKLQYDCLPTFIGIGSMRCGSTWLCEVLKQHPDIRIADEKEMDFFFMPRMLQHDLGWYAAHFSPSRGERAKPVRGEISPRYARLKAWQVKRLAQFLPMLRIVLTLRHPIERAWSQAVYDFGRLQQRDVRNVSSLEFIRQLELARSRLSSDYDRMLRIWTGAFGWEAVHVDFFDRLRAEPQSYIDGILKHIGASTPWALPEAFAKKKVWATRTLVKDELQIPETLQAYIADRLLSPTERLNEMLQGRVTHWVEEMQALRRKLRPGWRILKELNRVLLALPQRCAYEAYHVTLDVRFWMRWRRLLDVSESPSVRPQRSGCTSRERIG
jgi:Sulfotransferase family